MVRFLWFIVTLPVRGVAWLFKTWKWYIAFGVMAILTVVIVGIVVSATAKHTRVAPTTPVQAITTPSATEAPYLVQTSSLYYFAGKVTQDGKNFVLQPYWYFNSVANLWVKAPSFTITPNFGKIQVTKR